MALLWCLNLLKLNEVKDGYIYTFRSPAASDSQESRTQICSKSWEQIWTEPKKTTMFGEAVFTTQLSFAKPAGCPPISQLTTTTLWLYINTLSHWQKVQSSGCRFLAVSYSEETQVKGYGGPSSPDSEALYPASESNLALFLSILILVPKRQ